VTSGHASPVFLRTGRHLTAVLLCWLLCLWCRPGRAEDSSPIPADPKPYDKTVESGPMKVRLTLDRTCLWIGENITLTLEAMAPEEYAIELPALEEGIRQFRWELAKSDAPRLGADGNMLTRRVLTLEPLVIPEKLAVLPLTVKFILMKDGVRQKEYDLSTDEVVLEVTMPPEEFWQKLDVVPTAAENPMERLGPPSYRLWLWLVVPAIVLCLLLWRHLRRTKETTAVPPPDPYEIAVAALRMLMADNLPARGELMAFYNRIQQILRDYVEARFEVHAPERTTEEFLLELRTRPELEAHRALLQQFLTHCDLVRFAAHQPEESEINATADACRAFLQSTRQTGG